MALTELGFERPTYDEILENQINRAKELFGDTIDTSELTALGKFIRINVADLDTLYQTLEGVYYARFPNTANGVSLDRLCPFAGITRNAATYARHQVTLKGTAGATIEAGFEVSNENQSVIFHLICDYVIGDKGDVTALVDSNDTGTVGNIPSSLINTIVNPSADVESVSGDGLVRAGEERESDAKLRTRFSKAIAGTGSGTAEAIKGAVMRVNGVEDCTIVENAEGTIVNGIQPYSFRCFVLYDSLSNTEQEIGQAIFNKKPIGITTDGSADGSISVDVEDESGTKHTVVFYPTTRKDIYIKIELTKNNFFEDNGVEKIKTNLVNYLSTFTNGATVYLSALYSYINITGVVNVSSLMLSIDGETYSAADISCSDNEVARTEAAKISITIS